MPILNKPSSGREATESQLDRIEKMLDKLTSGTLDLTSFGSTPKTISAILAHIEKTQGFVYDSEEGCFYLAPPSKIEDGILKWDEDSETIVYSPDDSDLPINSDLEELCRCYSPITSRSNPMFCVQCKKPLENEN